MKATQLEFKFKTKADHLADFVESIINFIYKWTPSIVRYESCFGFSLPHIGKKKVEVWYAPSYYKIKPHTHNNENIELYLLFGHNVRFHRLKKGTLLGESFFAKITDIGRHFTIDSGTIHSFDVSSYPLIFMNVETWLTDKPTSASQDLQLL